MKRSDAIKILLAVLKKEDMAFFATGMISREAFDIDDRESNFYVIGSMGLVSSLGLGVALNTKKRVVVFDGDGSLLMNMGIMPLIASLKPSNFIHVVLDNGSYQSTGGQSTIAGKISLANIARAAGYNKVFEVIRPLELKEMAASLFQKGPVFILVKVDKKGTDDIGRVTHKPARIRERFKRAVIGRGQV